MITLPEGAETKRNLITLGAGASFLTVSALAARVFKKTGLAQVGALLSLPASAYAYTQIEIASSTLLPAPPPTGGSAPSQTREMTTLPDDFVSLRELRGSHPLHDLAKEFQQRGGTLTVLNWNDPDTSITLPTTGNVYPVCEEGRNRSQLLYQHLHALIGDRAQLPHGVSGGCDPFMHHTVDDSNPLHWTPPTPGNFPDPGAYGYSPLSQEGERDAIGRVLRFGEQQLIAVRKLDPSLFTQAGFELDLHVERGMNARKRMRTLMDALYFLPMIRDGGTVIAFNKAPHAMMMRLVENAKQLGLRLDGVTLIATEAGDPVVADDQDAAIAAFKASLQTGVKKGPVDA